MIAAFPVDLFIKRGARLRAWGLLALCCVSACARAPWSGFPSPSTTEIWPPPPDSPRAAFVTEIREHRDLFQEAGALRALQRLVGGPVDSAMLRPFAVALHPAGGLLVTDPGRGRVHFYCWGRRRYIALDGGDGVPLPSPVGVAALPDGRILISDSRLARVLTFDPAGKPLSDFIVPRTLQRPAGIAVDPVAGTVYIADVTAHRIGAFALDGALLRWIGSHGGAPGQLNYPTHIAVGPNGALAVADSMNFRVQVLSPTGEVIAFAGALGAAPGKFANPKGVAIDGAGRIYAIEGLHDALQVFSPTGELLLSLGGPGQNHGEYWLPAGLTLDPTQNLLFVADSYNRRVQVFRLLEEPSP